MSIPIHWVYVICHIKDGQPCAPVKIGVSNKPDHRLASLQTANSEQLILFACFSFPRDWANNIETDAHEILANDRLRGEWFSTPPIQATAAICQWMLYLVEELPDEQSRVDVLHKSGTIRTIEQIAKYDAWLKLGATNASPAN